jgi:hypothetical protein
MKMIDPKYAIEIQNGKPVIVKASTGIPIPGRVFPTAKEARRRRVKPERIVPVEIREATKKAGHV